MQGTNIEQLCAQLRSTLEATPERLVRRCVEHYVHRHGSYPTDRKRAVVLAYKDDVIDTDELMRVDGAFGYGLFTLEVA